MSKDYIGPFGRESIEAAARKVAEIADDNGWAGEWDRLSVEDKAASKHEAVDILSAAAGALDREALVEKAYVAINGAAPGYGPYGFARLAFEALFPTEPEVQHGR